MRERLLEVLTHWLSRPRSRSGAVLVPPGWRQRKHWHTGSAAASKAGRLYDLAATNRHNKLGMTRRRQPADWRERQ